MENNFIVQHLEHIVTHKGECFHMLLPLCLMRKDGQMIKETILLPRLDCLALKVNL